MLNEMGIPNPSAYKRLKGYNYRHPAGAKNDGLWPDSSVRMILRNQMYIGNMVQGKNTTVSYKIRQCRSIPKSDWIIVENTHEPIIDKETFEKAQALFSSHVRTPPAKGEVYLFSGLVRCSDCRRIMNRKTNVHSYGTYHYYRCSTARKMHKTACTNHSIRIDKMEQAVLIFLQTTIKTAVSFNELLQKINSNAARKKDASHLQKTLKAQQAEREKYMQAMAALYPDWKCGILTQEEYVTIKATLSEKIASLDSLIANLQKSAERYASGITAENDFLSHFLKYQNIDRLTRSMLIELVEEILVHEGGRIEINLKFRDAYREVVEYIEMNKKLTETA